ncbi:TPA: ankyrin repeat domain-containing protein [Escherichia coli]
MNSINELLLIYGSNITKIKELVLAGANVNYVSPEGLTPLSCAESVEVVQFLLSRGADVNATNEDGKTALFSVSNVDTCRFLIENGARVNHVNNKHETALFYTTDMKKIRLLVEAGCDPLVRSYDGKRHYDLLAHNQKVSFINFLANRKKKMETVNAPLALAF